MKTDNNKSLKLNDISLTDLIEKHDISADSSKEIQRRISLCEDKMPEHEIFNILKFKKSIDSLDLEYSIGDDQTNTQLHRIIDKYFLGIFRIGRCGRIIDIFVAEYNPSKSDLRKVVTGVIAYDTIETPDLNIEYLTTVNADKSVIKLISTLYDNDDIVHEEEHNLAYLIKNYSDILLNNQGTTYRDFYDGKNPGHIHSHINFMGPSERGICFGVYYLRERKDLPGRKIERTRIDVVINNKNSDILTRDLGNGVVFKVEWEIKK